MKSVARQLYEKKIMKGMKKSGVVSMDESEVSKFGYDELKLWCGYQGYVCEHIFYLGDSQNNHLMTIIAINWMRLFFGMDEQIQGLRRNRFVGEPNVPYNVLQAEKVRQLIIDQLQDQLNEYKAKYPNKLYYAGYLKQKGETEELTIEDFNITLEEVMRMPNFKPSEAVKEALDRRGIMG